MTETNWNCNGAEVCETESKDLENAWKLFSANKKRTFVAVQISPAVRVAIGERLGLQRGEDGVGKVAAVLTALGADAVVDTAIVSDALVLMKAKILRERKENGKGSPLYSSECPAWVEHAKNAYPEIAEDLLPTATEVCAKLLKKYYGQQNPTKKIRVIALEMGEAKKGALGADVVLTLEELAKMLQSTEANIRLMKKEPLSTPFGVGSGAGYISAVSGGDAEALARCLATDKTQDFLRKFEYSGLYGKREIREAAFTLDGTEWRFAVADSLAAADALIEKISAGEASYDYVEVTACAGGCVGVGCDPADEEGEMTRRLRKLGLKYLDFGRAARSADGSSAAAVLVKAWNSLCRSGEAAAMDLIDEIEDDPEEIVEEVVETVEEIAETVEKAPVAEEAVAETPVEVSLQPEQTEISEEPVAEESAVEEAVAEELEAPVLVEEVAEETVEEPISEELAEEPVPEEAEEEAVAEENSEEALVVEEVAEATEEPVVEEAAGKEGTEEETEETEELAPVEEVEAEEPEAPVLVEEVVAEEPETPVLVEETEEPVETAYEEVVEETAAELIEEETAPAEISYEEVTEEEAAELIEEENAPAESVYEEVTEEAEVELVEEEAVSAEAVYEEIAEESVADEVVTEVAEETVEESETAEEVAVSAAEETDEEEAPETDETAEFAEELPVAETEEEKEPEVKVSAEELAEEIKHVQEYLNVAEEDLTAAQKLARAHYYRRLSTKERRKLKRQRRNNK